jgi:hypothetical protein
MQVGQLALYRETFAFLGIIQGTKRGPCAKMRARSIEHSQLQLSSLSATTTIFKHVYSCR